MKSEFFLLNISFTAPVLGDKKIFLKTMNRGSFKMITYTNFESLILRLCSNALVLFIFYCVLSIMYNDVAKKITNSPKNKKKKRM